MTNKEKKEIQLLMLIFFGVLAILVLIVVFTFMFSPPKSQQTQIPAETIPKIEELNIAETEEIITEITTTSLGYCLKEFDGFVALFKEGENMPYEKTEFPVYLLSDNDKESIQKGIKVATEQELKRLVEDLCD